MVSDEQSSGSEDIPPTAVGSFVTVRQLDSEHGNPRRRRSRALPANRSAMAGRIKSGLAAAIWSRTP